MFPHLLIAENARKATCRMQGSVQPPSRAPRSACVAVSAQKGRQPRDEPLAAGLPRQSAVQMSGFRFLLEVAADEPSVPKQEFVRGPRRDQPNTVLLGSAVVCPQPSGGVPRDQLRVAPSYVREMPVRERENLDRQPGGRVVRERVSERVVG